MIEVKIPAAKVTENNRLLSEIIRWFFHNTTDFDRDWTWVRGVWIGGEDYAVFRIRDPEVAMQFKLMWGGE